LKRILILAGAALVAVVAAIPVFGINYGNPDNNEHPYVGLAVFHDASGTPLWRCSGTLMSSTIFLTAGHCTEAPAASAHIWFDEDVQSGIPENGYPFGGKDIPSGTPYTHPQYNPNAFYLHDLGVVVLDKPVKGISTFGQLPELGALDKLATQRGLQNLTIEAVGYGLQYINPVFVEGQRIRLKADLQVVDLNGTAGIPAGTSVMVSGDANHGGTCFGDSGGPQFLGTNSRVVVAVTSFGLNQNCSGVGGGYRVDQADDLEWLATFFSARGARR
jgi:hypothetical protein